MEDEGRSAEDSSGEDEYLNLVNATAIKGLLRRRRRRCRRTLRRVRAHQVMYVDGEDGSGNIIEGRWRRDNEARTTMQPVTRTGSNR